MSFLIPDSASESSDSANNSDGLALLVHGLALLAKEGDLVAFENLYKLYYNRICVYLLNIVGDDGIACELTQETFLNAWKSLPSLRETVKFTSWLYRIATNLAYDYKRKNKNKKLEYFGKLKDLEIASPNGPEELTEAKELMSIALSQVPWKYRICVILYYIEGFSKQQIAEIVKVKKSSVGVYTSAGLEQLRQAYKKLSTE